MQRQVAPFTVPVPPGHYPVTLSLARGLFDHPKIPVRPLGAAAKLTILDEPVVRWEVALQPGEDPATLHPDQIFTLGVDSGNASFVDASAVGALAHFVESLPEDRFLTELGGRGWVNLVVDKAADLNIVIFHCGLGDGGYATWIGRTEAGAPACFIVDLLVLTEATGPIID